MLPYMPFVNEYWPFIVAGVLCYLGARFAYHSAVSWNPKPKGAHSYRTPDQGKSLKVWLTLLATLQFGINVFPSHF